MLFVLRVPRRPNLGDPSAFRRIHRPESQSRHSRNGCTFSTKKYVCPNITHSIEMDLMPSKTAKFELPGFLVRMRSAKFSWRLKQVTRRTRIESAIVPHGFEILSVDQTKIKEAVTPSGGNRCQEMIVVQPRISPEPLVLTSRDTFKLSVIGSMAQHSSIIVPKSTSNVKTMIIALKINDD